MRRFTAFAFALFLSTTAVLAQAPGDSQPCNPTTQDCTVLQALDFFRNNPVAVQVVNTNRATTAPNGFAKRIHNSYDDYLNLLSFAVNKVEESDNGQALIVHFNPLRSGRNLVGTTLTVSQPAVSSAVAANIPDGLRTDTVAALQKKMGDFDDLTWALSYSFATPVCSNTTTGTCWGRTPSTYWPLIGSLVGSDGTLGEAVTTLRSHFQSSDTPLTQRRLSLANDKAATLQAIRDLVAKERSSTAADAYLKVLPTLIDNQPQISATGNYHTFNRLGGPDQLSASLEFHKGRENVNTLRGRCPEAKGDALVSCVRTQLKNLAADGVPSDKYVFTVTYKKTDDFKVAAADLPSTVTGFKPVAQKESNQLSIKGQGGFLLGAKVGSKEMRADGSLEVLRAKKDGVRSPNRAVATITLAVPLGENMTVPLSITYANKPEFLGDPKERLGAHLGISYRLPSLFGGTP